MTEVSDEQPDEGWMGWFLNRTGGKAEHHHFLTGLLSQHEELWKTPHQQKMYSDSYRNVQRIGKLYCSDIFMLKWKHTTQKRPDAAELTPDMYQHFANEQAAAQECLSDSLNLYFDTVQALGGQYAACKQDCLAKNEKLRKEIEDFGSDKKGGQRTRYFNPHSSDSCLSQCRS